MNLEYYPIICPVCHGMGEVKKFRKATIAGPICDDEKCPICHGLGSVVVGRIKNE